MQRVTASTFLDFFLKTYQESREKFQSADSWQAVWSTEAWNRFMMWKAKPPEPLERSVLYQVAFDLKLDYWDGNPLTIDGAFYQRSPWPAVNFPFSMRVAFEHENDHRGFLQEIVKLLSVRCPLKVGVTYTLLFGERNNPQARQEILKSIGEQVDRSFAMIQGVTGEDTTTEYLFLVGAEETVRELKWYKLRFSAATGPATAGFIIA